MIKGQIIIIEGQTLKGKNKVREAGTNEWVVLETCENVSCLKGPGALIAPLLEEGPNRNKMRWVCLKNDPDFVIHD